MLKTSVQQDIGREMRVVGERLGKGGMLFAKQVRLLLIQAALLAGMPLYSMAATPTPDQMTQVPLFTFTAQFGKTTSDCVFEIPAMGTNLDGVTVTWSGSCLDGLVSGPGRLRGALGEHEVFSYEGRMLVGMPDGEGTYHLSGVITLTGRFQGTKLDDEHAVISTEQGFRYEGAAKGNWPDGFGVAVFPDGARYEGQWHHGKPEGHGVKVWTSGVRYDGEWRAGKRSGQGVVTYSSGARYEGEFQDGKRNGHGVWSTASGVRYEGHWQDDALNGPGSLISPSNGQQYDGELLKGRPNGKGVAVSADGMRYDGEWSDGKYNGTGTLTLPGEPPFAGTWVNGCFSDRGRRAALGKSQQGCQ